MEALRSILSDSSADVNRRPDTRGIERPAAAERGYRLPATGYRQATPLTVNAVGAVSLLVHVPWNPNDALAPLLIVPL